MERENINNFKCVNNFNTPDRLLVNTNNSGQYLNTKATLHQGPIYKWGKNYSTSTINNTKNSVINTTLLESLTCKSLVIWGNNLSSGVGLGRYSKQVSEMIKIPPFQYSIMVGLLLSDG